jgi:flagellar protein FlbD
MIELHRLGSAREEFLLNPDLISVIEAHPDTVITLTTGVKVLVTESPREITALIREWRAAIARDAVGTRPLRSV